MLEAENEDQKNLITAHIMILPRGDGLEHDTFIGRKHEQDGNPVCHECAHKLLNSNIYKVESIQGGFIFKNM